MSNCELRFTSLLCVMAFEFNAYSALLLPFCLQGGLVGLVLWARSRREESAADAWLALLLALFAARLAQWMLGFAGWYDAHNGLSSFMFYFPFANWLAVGPALYCYFRSLTNQEFRFQWRRHGWHFAPALAVVAWRLVAAAYDMLYWRAALGRPFPAHFGTKGPLMAWTDAQPLFGALEVLGYVAVLLYAVRTLREYRAYARYLNDNFSDTAQIRFRWLRNVLMAVVVGTGVALGFMLINDLLQPLSYIQAWYDYLFTGLLIYYLSIAGLLTGHRLAALRFQPAELPPPAEAAQPAAEPADLLAADPGYAAPAPATAESVGSKSVAPAVPAQATAPAALPPDAELARWTGRLTAHMTAARPYLQPELTLGELAAQLRTNTTWLSRVINSGCGQNFNDFVNEYRVQEAERRLQDPRYQHFTLLAVALESGFNSKSTFNRVFRKLRGATPSEVARLAG